MPCKTISTHAPAGNMTFPRKEKQTDEKEWCSVWLWHRVQHTTPKNATESAMQQSSGRHYEE